MTLEEVIALAEQGDRKAFIQLADYYYGKEATKAGTEDIDKAIYWYIRGTEFGYSEFYLLAGQLKYIKGLEILGPIGNANEEEASCAIKEFRDAWDLSIKAIEHNIKHADNLQENIAGELGIALHALAFEGDLNLAKKRLDEAIYYLKFAYNRESSLDIEMFLALSIATYNSNSQDDWKLFHTLAHNCVDKHFNERGRIAIIARDLGKTYITGRACPIDYDKAHFYLMKAHKAGVDCSDLLSKFKEKFFGGWKYIG